MNQVFRRRRPRMVVTLKVGYASEQRTGRGTTLDLSMGGMFLQVHEAFAEGDWLRVSFHIRSGQEMRPVHATGQILRVQAKPLLGEQFPGVALEFRKFHEGLESLRQFLAAELGLQPHEVGSPGLGLAPDLPAPPPAPAGHEHERHGHAPAASGNGPGA